jgi:hypothetical protein
MNSFDTLRILFKGFPNKHKAQTLPDGGNISECEGWKIASIIDPLLGKFKGLAYGTYGMKDIAKCQYDLHASPVENCGCGFYSFKNKKDAEKILNRREGFFLLKVEHFGKIVEHKLGFRSQEQDVVAIEIPNVCSNLWCKTRPVGLSLVRKTWQSVCVKHRREDFVNFQMLRENLSIPIIL